MNPRTERVRQRAVALELIQDDGPMTAEELERDQERNLSRGVTEDDLCDQLEELLDSHEDRDVVILWASDET